MRDIRCTFSVYNYCQTLPQSNVTSNAFYILSRSVIALRIQPRMTTYLICNPTNEEAETAKERETERYYQSIIQG